MIWRSWETKHKDDFEPFWQDEKDWLYIVEFLPTDNPEARAVSLRRRAVEPCQPKKDLARVVC